MSRRAANGITRVIPAVLEAGAVLVLAALLAACGGSSGGPSSSPSATMSPSQSASPTASPTLAPSAPTTTAQALYFLRDGKLGVAERATTPSTMPATAAVHALLAGPSAAERAAGLTSVIPTGTTLKSLALSGNVATVNLSQGPDTTSAALLGMPGTAELVYTLTRFRTISGVRVQVGGRPWPSATDAGPSPVSLPPRRVPRLRAGHLRRVARRRRRAARPVRAQRHCERVRRVVHGAAHRRQRAPGRARQRPGVDGSSRPRRVPPDRRVQHVGHPRNAHGVQRVGGGRQPSERRRDPRHPQAVGEKLAGSAGVTPACVGLEPTLILPIDPPPSSILLPPRTARGRGRAATS